MAAPSGIGLAIKQFGKLTAEQMRQREERESGTPSDRSTGQSLTEFRDEWSTLSAASKAQLAEGMLNETLTYPDPNPSAALAA